MRVTVVGCGDAFGSGGRFNTCFMVESGGRAILHRLRRFQPVALRARAIDTTRIDGIILSHLHGDHFGGIPFFLLDGQFLSRRERPLTLRVHPAPARGSMLLSRCCFRPRPERSGVLPGRWWRWRSARAARFLGFGIETAEVKHYSGASSTAVRLHDGERILAYSGDTEWTDALIGIADGADLFITECYRP